MQPLSITHTKELERGIRIVRDLIRKTPVSKEHDQALLRLQEAYLWAVAAGKVTTLHVDVLSTE